jgi:hypothetical protein
MILSDQWAAISARIRGLADAARLFSQFQGVSRSDSYGGGRSLSEQYLSVYQSLEQFRDGFQPSLPTGVFDTISQFLSRHGSLFTDQSGTRNLRRERAEAALLFLVALELEVSFLLANSAEIIRARSERAFAHLQRLIVADPSIRAVWQSAHADGEVACERLGAAHLLWHGIYAFKVNATGERTDLVFQEPVAVGELSRYSDGLVLTEWKRSTSPSDVEDRFGEARRQAARYAEGALAGLELASHRYAIVVSREQVFVPADRQEGDISYRHINIAVAPTPPSRAS